MCLKVWKWCFLVLESDGMRIVLDGIATRGCVISEADLGGQGARGQPPPFLGKNLVAYIGNHWSMTGAGPLLGSQWAPSYGNFWIRHWILFIITRRARSLRCVNWGQLSVFSMFDTLLVLWYLLQAYRAALLWTIELVQFLSAFLWVSGYWCYLGRWLYVGWSYLRAFQSRLMLFVIHWF